MDQFLRGLISYLFSGFLNLVQNVHANYFLELELHKRKAISAALMLKGHSEYLLSNLVDVVSLDRPGPRFRFTVLYSVSSHILNNRFFFSYQFKEGAPIESLINLFESSAWAERECWDMHGVYFVNHDNFLRVLTDYGFKGHPLRKDFPLSGFLELFYDDCDSAVIYEPVELMQEYRNFDFTGPWSDSAAEASRDEPELQDVNEFEENGAAKT